MAEAIMEEGKISEAAIITVAITATVIITAIIITATVTITAMAIAAVTRILKNVLNKSFLHFESYKIKPAHKAGLIFVGGYVKCSYEENHKAGR